VVAVVVEDVGRPTDRADRRGSGVHVGKCCGRICVIVPGLMCGLMIVQAIQEAVLIPYLLWLDVPLEYVSMLAGWQRSGLMRV